MSNHEETQSVSTLYSVIASCIFIVMAYNFLFPCNKLLPLDRRTIATVSALLCYLSRAYIFPNHRMDLVSAVDFDVLILLASIMIINHIVIHLKETKTVIEYLQIQVQTSPVKGFWLVSFAAFIVSPFLTNDGVCLLFVEPILNAFDTVIKSENNNSNNHNNENNNDNTHDNDNNNNNTITTTNNNNNNTNESNNKKTYPLHKSDALYFLLALACSSNIGSCLTYTGNPQNMIVASDSIYVMPSYKFLIYMLAPSLFSWIITMKVIERNWQKSKENIKLLNNEEISPDDIEMAPRISNNNNNNSHNNHNNNATIDDTTALLATTTNQLIIARSVHHETNDINNNNSSNSNSRHSKHNSNTHLSLELPSKLEEESNNNHNNIVTNDNYTKDSDLGEIALSPRQIRSRERIKMIKNVVHVVSSPFPYMILLLLILMIIMIFVDVMPISGLICVFALAMVVAIVLGNHWRNQLIWEETYPVNYYGQPFTKEDKRENLNEFFESLFNSIDYSLLIIFLGTFIVIENMASTGIPKTIWDKIVGKVPFKSFGSIVGISLFVLIASQFLGNVAIVQLAKPNVESLDDSSKRFAWAIISYVATVGGNLTITGSAANIIVAEKAARLDASISMDFFNHYRVCFWITVACCFAGGALLSAIVMLDNQSGSNW